MSAEGLLLSLVLVAVVVLWLMLPFFLRGEDNISENAIVTRQRERLMIYYERVLRNLHDIDEDHATGKLNEDQYIQEREQWVRRGIAALQALDNLGTDHLIAPGIVNDAVIDQAIDEVIESAITTHKTTTTA